VIHDNFANRKGKLLETSAFPGSITGQEGQSLPAIEVGDFLWYCTQQPNEDEPRITNGKRNLEFLDKNRTNLDLLLFVAFCCFGDELLFLFLL